jgi:hypothetical protein
MQGVLPDIFSQFDTCQYFLPQLKILSTRALVTLGYLKNKFCNYLE